MCLMRLIDKPLAFAALLGEGMTLLYRSLGYLLSWRLKVKAWLHQCVHLGVDSLGMVLLINAIAGMVLALQSATTFRQTGTQDYVGGLVSLAIVREMAPLFTAMAVGARAGTAMASEIGHMAVTNQLAAHQVLRVDSIRLLVLPRLAAGMATLPVLTMLAQVVAIVAGMFTAELTVGINRFLFLESAWLALAPRDIVISMGKALLFGVVVVVTSCVLGLRTQGGSLQVGQSAMRAAVWVAVLVVLVDFLLTWLLY